MVLFHAGIGQKLADLGRSDFWGGSGIVFALAATKIGTIFLGYLACCYIHAFETRRRRDENLRIRAFTLACVASQTIMKFESHIVIPLWITAMVA